MIIAHNYIFQGPESKMLEFIRFHVWRIIFTFVFALYMCNLNFSNKFIQIKSIGGGIL